MRIAIGNDHGGVDLKNKLVQYLENKGHYVINCGSDIPDRVDYPIYGFKIGEEVAKGNADFGIAICKSAIGITVACNKVKGIRCGAVYNVADAIHAVNNDYINVIGLSGENITIEENIKILEAYMMAKPIDDSAYLRRKNQIEAYENGESYE